MTVKSIKQLSLVALTCLFVNLSHADTTPTWQLPNKAMHFAYQEEQMTVFQGKLQLSGTLTLGWNDDALEARFAPDRASRKKLPVIRDDYYRDKINIGLALDGMDWSFVEPNFTLPPKLTTKQLEAWQKKNGDFDTIVPALSYPASITINEFMMGVDCDSRWHRAKVIDIKPPKSGQKQKGKVAELDITC